MDVNTKLQEMEEEVKVLKAEIRNVLLDIREVILERTNPLDGPEPALIRMDLRTTASAMAAEAAAHEARNAMEAAEAMEPTPHPEEHATTSLPIAAEALHPAPEPAPEAHADEPIEEPPPPKVIRRDPRELKMLAEEKDQQPIEIPSAYRVEFAPLSGNGSLSAWLSAALQAVGPHELSRIIAVHRSWGNLPPNISRALAYVQEMLEETQDTDPAWLRVMQQLDELASL